MATPPTTQHGRPPGEDAPNVPVPGDARPPADRRSSGGATRTLLVVDDDTHVLEVVRRMLDGAGYCVLTAADGDEALRLLGHQPIDQPIDLVLCDVLMPGKEGIETCTQIVRRHPGLPVVVMSGALRADTYLRMALRLGASGRLSKPFGRDELLDAVRQALVGAR